MLHIILDGLRLGKSKIIRLSIPRPKGKENLNTNLKVAYSFIVRLNLIQNWTTIQKRARARINRYPTRQKPLSRQKRDPMLQKKMMPLLWIARSKPWIHEIKWLDPPTVKNLYSADFRNAVELKIKVPISSNTEIFIQEELEWIVFTEREREKYYRYYPPSKNLKDSEEVLEANVLKALDSVTIQEIRR